MSDVYLPGDIKVISLLEAVRKRPSMYIGDLDNPELPLELAKEAFCHAIDEMEEGNCDYLSVFIYPDWLTLTYGGAMPMEEVNGKTKAFRMVTDLAACSNLKKNIKVGDEYCKHGLAVLNACSELFCLSTYGEMPDNVKAPSARYVFQNGELTKEELKEVKWSRDYHAHTCISLRLDSELLPYHSFKGLSLESFLEELKSKYDANIRYERLL